MIAIQWPVQQTDFPTPISAPRHRWIQRSSRNIAHSEATNNNTKADCKSEEVSCLDRIGYSETWNDDWPFTNRDPLMNMHPSFFDVKPVLKKHVRVQGDAYCLESVTLGCNFGQFDKNASCILSNARGGGGTCLGDGRDSHAQNHVGQGEGENQLSQKRLSEIHRKITVHPGSTVRSPRLSEEISSFRSEGWHWLAKYTNCNESCSDA